MKLRLLSQEFFLTTECHISTTLLSCPLKHTVHYIKIFYKLTKYMKELTFTNP